MINFRNRILNYVEFLIALKIAYFIHIRISRRGVDKLEGASTSDVGSFR